MLVFYVLMKKKMNIFIPILHKLEVKHFHTYKTYFIYSRKQRYVISGHLDPLSYYSHLAMLNNHNWVTTNG